MKNPNNPQTVGEDSIKDNMGGFWEAFQSKLNLIPTFAYVRVAYQLIEKRLKLRQILYGLLQAERCQRVIKNFIQVSVRSRR